MSSELRFYWALQIGVALGERGEVPAPAAWNKPAQSFNSKLPSVAIADGNR